MTGCGRKRRYSAPVACDVSGRSAEAQLFGICSSGNSLVGQVTCTSGAYPDVAHVRPCAPVGLEPDTGGCEAGTGAFNDCISGSKF
jgi:hypothetical protein